jgi:hypothetical protein
MSSLAPPTAASTTPTRPTWAFWNTYHTLFCVFLGAYILYVAVVIGRMSGHNDEPVPRPVNAIALTALSLAAMLSFVAAANRTRSDRDLEWQTAVKSEIARLCGEQSAVAEALRAVATGFALLNQASNVGPDDEPTVRLNGRHVSAAGQAYASATVVSGGRIDSIAERVERMAATVEAACVLVETSRGDAGASRPDGGWGTPGQRLNAGPADMDLELRGYLKGVYDREMRPGDDPPN